MMNQKFEIHLRCNSWELCLKWSLVKCKMHFVLYINGVNCKLASFSKFALHTEQKKSPQVILKRSKMNEAKLKNFFDEFKKIYKLPKETVEKRGGSWPAYDNMQFKN